ncbi:hypothetical protein [Ensifer sp. ENS10]|uniref:hypothetical protein n=2 Tax=unclassified Ensifer TaxID=2633371 RepID=UPI0035C86B68
MTAAQPRGSTDPRFKRERFLSLNGPCRLDSNNSGGLDKGALLPYVARAKRLARMCLAAAGSSPAALRLNSLEQPNPFVEVQFTPTSQRKCSYRIWGLPGNDELDGGGGNDLLDGGAGDDLLRSARGYDRLDGGEGDDRIVLLGTGGAVTGGAGFDTFVVDLSMKTVPVRFNGVSGHALIDDGNDFADHIFFNNIERLGSSRRPGGRRRTVGR